MSERILPKDNFVLSNFEVFFCRHRTLSVKGTGKDPFGLANSERKFSVTQSSRINPSAMYYKLSIPSRPTLKMLSTLLFAAL